MIDIRRGAEQRDALLRRERSRSFPACHAAGAGALVTGSIAGPRTFEQWEHYLGALDYKFTAEDEALIDRLVAPGHPSTPGYNDPAYPLEGRVPRSG